MNRLLSWTLAALLLWAVAACGGSPARSGADTSPTASPDPTSNPDPAPGSTSPGSTSPGGTTPIATPQGALEIRIRGFAQGTVGALRLGVTAVDVVADGIALPLTGLRPGDVDLGRADHAWLLGYVAPASGAQRLDVAIHLAPSCTFTTAAGDAPCDARGLPILLSASLPALAGSKHVVAAIEVEPSLLQAQGLAGMFVPQYRVEY